MTTTDVTVRRRRLAALGIVGAVSLAAGLAVAASEDGGGKGARNLPGREGVPLLGGGRPLGERLEAAAKAVDELARRDPGELGVALAPVGGGRVHTGGELLEGPAWSAIKVPLVAAFLGYRADQEKVEAGGAVLSMRQSELIESALTRSDNDAAADLFEAMARTGGAARARRRLQAALEAAGDRRTVVAQSVDPESGRVQYGATRWRLEDALRYFRQLSRGCALPAPDTLLVLSYLSRVVPSQRWGVPQAIGAGTPVAFKGGWGPGDDLRWLAEQIAIVGHGGSAYVVALMARTPVQASSLADPRSYNAARRLLRRGADAVQAVIGPPGSGPGAPAARC